MIAALILATDSALSAKTYKPIKLPFSSSLISKERSALLQMDAP
jgi:hypothetical protein